MKLLFRRLRPENFGNDPRFPENGPARGTENPYIFSVPIRPVVNGGSAFRPHQRTVNEISAYVAAVPGICPFQPCLPGHWRTVRFHGNYSDQKISARLSIRKADHAFPVGEIRRIFPSGFLCELHRLLNQLAFPESDSGLVKHHQNQDNGNQNQAPCKKRIDSRHGFSRFGCKRGRLTTPSLIQPLKSSRNFVEYLPLRKRSLSSTFSWKGIVVLSPPRRISPSVRFIRAIASVRFRPQQITLATSES